MRRKRYQYLVVPAIYDGDNLNSPRIAVVYDGRPEVLLSVSGFLEDAERRAGRKSRGGHMPYTGAKRMERAGHSTQGAPG
jgi:hypothetical protein